MACGGAACVRRTTTKMEHSKRASIQMRCATLIPSKCVQSSEWRHSGPAVQGGSHTTFRQKLARAPLGVFPQSFALVAVAAHIPIRPSSVPVADESDQPASGHHRRRCRQPALTACHNHPPPIPWRPPPPAAAAENPRTWRTFLRLMPQLS